MSGEMLPLVIASMGHVERAVHKAQVAPEAQQVASQHIALESLRNENKQIHKTTEGEKSFKVGDETPEERKKRRQSEAEREAEQEQPEQPEAPKKPWSGNLLDLKI